MPKVKKVAVLTTILEQIQKENDLVKVRKICLDRVETSKVNPTGKAKMVQILTDTPDRKLLASIYNLILKYEGNGVI